MNRIEEIKTQLREVVIELNDIMYADDGSEKLYKNAFEELSYLIENNLQSAKEQYDAIKQSGLSFSLVDSEGSLRNAMYIVDVLKTVKENYLI
jgi:hypothetical protein